MKERAKKILDFIIKNNNVTSQELQEKFNVSKRTIYYDILAINKQLGKSGNIKNVKHKFIFEGNLCDARKIISTEEDKFLDSDYRKTFILNKILLGEKISIEKLTNEMLLSKNTVVQTITDVKKYLQTMGLRLEYKGKYKIIGDEYVIRELFLIIVQENVLEINSISEEVSSFDTKGHIKLTDYSLLNLTKFVEFLNKRIRDGKTLYSYKYLNEAKKISYFSNCKELLCEEANENEQAYICTYISSLPSLNSEVKEDVVEEYVDKLIDKFEVNTAIKLESKHEFKKNILRHLHSSYNRIRFKFPIRNPMLDETKYKHESLYKIIKSIIENEEEFPVFEGIREEEIGFIAAYFGGYLRGSRDNGLRRNKVLLVCPNGLMVSKSLEIQLYKYIPTIEIVGIVSIKQLKEVNVYYDYIITTIDIQNVNNVIVVNPLLTSSDVQLLMNKLISVKENEKYFNLELIIQAIRKNGVINNEEALKADLLNIIHKIDEGEMYQPMLKELINAERVNIIKNVRDWKEAIKIASKPLLEDNSIEELYIENMIKSVEKYGPYIVLADRFALPHASSKEGVNKLAMSLLIVEDEVDLLGKPVNIFMVLAAVDNTTHIRALASLSEMMYEEENVKLIINGDKSSILELINKQN
ncbi:TPA: transcription antiterminator [Clostridioides difficile]|uniref:Bifunctional B component of phosphotransferase system/transcriptional antiterminator n=1 Tax=Clostridioides difficile ATCC 9689 = DSM 1296 TaxID=1121308 RepID=A0AC59G1N4_CLODI|nr:BglG family transcription antiterminator [Clostridioides difficile]CCL65625.1 PTS system, fructose/mannitol-family IIAB component [Clostridioides difficile E7]AKP43514.1 bifunctional B component of phosphotransferase system/transcriptional antiterminator [Clostridioides difficile ATCC 9689 = DSM 1296]ARC16270.1 PTS transporter subunit IIAB [Clostridioides difficile]AVI13062.1 PTS transporter subunit IIAB [Clostridioides difficile]AXU87510.1 bifunctional B component of phosphotransferase sys